MSTGDLKTQIFDESDTQPDILRCLPEQPGVSINAGGNIRLSAIDDQQGQATQILRSLSVIEGKVVSNGGGTTGDLGGYKINGTQYLPQDLTLRGVLDKRSFVVSVRDEDGSERHFILIRLQKIVIAIDAALATKTFGELTAWSGDDVDIVMASLVRGQQIIAGLKGRETNSRVTQWREASGPLRQNSLPTVLGLIRQTTNQEIPAAVVDRIMSYDWLLLRKSDDNATFPRSAFRRITITNAPLSMLRPEVGLDEAHLFVVTGRPGFQVGIAVDERGEVLLCNTGDTLKHETFIDNKSGRQGHRILMSNGAKLIPIVEFIVDEDNIVFFPVVVEA